MINPLTRTIADWEISIKDNGVVRRNKSNPNKLNYLTNDRTTLPLGLVVNFFELSLWQLKE